MHAKVKVGKVLSGPEAAALLRRLAKYLEQNKLVVGDTVVEIENAVELAEALDVDGPKIAFDLRVSYKRDGESEPVIQKAQEVDAPPPEKEVTLTRSRHLKPAVKKLKKRMARSFKSILDSLQRNEIPKLDLVGSYCADAEVMTSSMEIGSEYFAEFKKGCGVLLTAVEQGDLEASIKAAGNVNQMRKDCHNRFKPF